MNYLIKMKNDNSFLKDSSMSNYFNFSSKSDPFLVFPSSKHHTDQAVGGGVLALKKIRSGQNP